MVVLPDGFGTQAGITAVNEFLAGKTIREIVA
jgi:hypothetical protein